MEANDGYGYLFLAVFLMVLIVIGIALIAVFASEYTGVAMLIVGVLAFSIVVLSLGLGSVSTDSGYM